MNITKMFFLMMFLSFSTVVSAVTIRVPDDQPTIQAGIDASSNGAIILVADGTYTGAGNRDIDFNGKAITVRSENGAESCVIDCQGSASSKHRGFYIHSGEGPGSVVQGFTIRNGYADGFPEGGGGIFCDASSPIIKENIIRNNEVYSASGAGIFCYGGASPMISDNTITYNICDAESPSTGGGGIGCFGACSPTIENNTIEHNFHYVMGGGIFCASGGSPIIKGNTICLNDVYHFGGGIGIQFSESTISNNIISGNHAGGEGGGWGGGIFYYNEGTYTTTIKNNLIIDNEAADLGGGIGHPYGSSSISVINNTIVGNEVYLSGGDGGGIYGAAIITNCILWGNAPDEIYGSSTATYSDVQGGHAGEGNIDANPIFVTGPLGDYYLSQVGAGQWWDSPCVDAGDEEIGRLPDTLWTGTTRTDLKDDAGTIDMGYHYPIKAFPKQREVENRPETLLETVH